MDKTSVWVRVDRSSAIQRGINGTATPVRVDLDVCEMSEEERVEIGARYYHYDRPGDTTHAVAGDVPQNEPCLLSRCNNGRISSMAALTVSQPDQAGVMEAITREARAIAVYAEDKQKRRAATETVLRERTTETVFAHYGADGTRHSYRAFAGAAFVRPTWPSVPDTDVTDSPAALAWEAELAAGNQQRRDDAIAARKAEIRGWIEAHGSNRLQRMLVEGIEHYGTYEAEREKWLTDLHGAAEEYEAGELASRLAGWRPGWIIVDQDDLNMDVADVDEIAFAILDAARLVAPRAKLASHKDNYVAVEEYEDGVWIIWPPK